MDIISLNDTSNKLFYVGGVVRDELLGIKSLDVDIVYEGNAIDYCTKFGEVVQINPDFGTIRVNVNEHEVDFASTRIEKYDRKGHLPQIVKIGCRLSEDYKRRDFTVNSLYKSVSTGEVIDFAGGLDDLKNKTLKVLHDESFVDDPTRIIRGLKFRARFGFELSDETLTLQREYFENINYDMCYKRVKKELIETFVLNRDDIFKKFIDEKIYKLLTENDIQIPIVSIENLINQYASASENVWLIYAAIVRDLSRLELTKKEIKILTAFDELEKLDLQNDFDIYKAFENVPIESIILYGILKDEKIARYYLDNLRQIKISINGKILAMAGIEPSPKYGEIFDFVLKQKLANPEMNTEEELSSAIEFFNS